MEKGTKRADRMWSLVHAQQIARAGDVARRVAEEEGLDPQEVRKVQLSSMMRAGRELKRRSR